MAGSLRFQHYDVYCRDDGSPVELGRGAMGITYRAHDTNLQCDVALKVINEALLSGDLAKERFLREARAAAAIRHPNVAAVYHLGEENGAIFYAMELIDGETVEDTMKREGACPAARALEIALQVSKALMAAERQGLVHRDIKPANLMLVRDGSDELLVKMIDFGLAKAADTAHSTAATLTSAGFLGTPHFASPEQLEEQELDTRSDIYALGVTLYYMLAGRTPFSGSLAQVMSQHLHREPPLDMLRGQPVGVLALLRRMMAKKPEDRPQSATDLRNEIITVLADLENAGPNDAVESIPVEAPDDLMDTAALTSPGIPTAFEPGPGVLLAGRFELIDEFRPGPHGRTFRAKNLETGSLVAVLILKSEILATNNLYTRFENEVTSLQLVRQPSVIRVESIERAHQLTWVTREWVDGRSLLDLLQQRGRLSPPEALSVVRALASGLDAVQASGIPCPPLAAHWIMMASTENGDLLPRFNPLDLSGGTAGGANSLSRTFPRHKLFAASLAALAVEMLGGRLTAPGRVESAGAVRPKTLAVLEKALNDHEGFSTAGAFADALSKSIGAPEAAVQLSGTAANPKHSRLPLIAASFITIILIAGGAGVWLALPALQTAFDAGSAERSPEPSVELDQPRVPESTGSEPPSISDATPIPTPVPEPTPVPVDPRLSAYESALASAEEIMLADDYAAALEILNDLVPEYPEHREHVTERIEQVAAKLRVDEPILEGDRLLILRPPLEEAAATGSVSAQMVLGDSLNASDPESAFKFFLLAAESGNSEAMMHVGEMYQRGRGTDQNEEKKFAWYKQAADRGNALAMLGAGEAYLFGTGTEQNLQTGIHYLTMAAAYGEPGAMTHLGDIYRQAPEGSGLEKPNYREAHRLFSEAASLGFLDAQANLGVMIIRGEVVDGEAVDATPDPERADVDQASRLFKAGADEGNALSTYFWAMCLQGGIGIAEQSSTQARAAYVRAAELGSKEAQNWCRKNGVRFRSPGSANPSASPSP